MEYLYMQTNKPKRVTYAPVVWMGIFKIPGDIVPMRMLHDLFEDMPSLVWVMAWCQQTTSHYLILCWPRSLLQYFVTRPPMVSSSMRGIWLFSVPTIFLSSRKRTGTCFPKSIRCFILPDILINATDEECLNLNPSGYSNSKLCLDRKFINCLLYSHF